MQQPATDRSNDDGGAPFYAARTPGGGAAGRDADSRARCGGVRARAVSASEGSSAAEPSTSTGDDGASESSHFALSQLVGHPGEAQGPDGQAAGAGSHLKGYFA